MNRAVIDQSGFRVFFAGLVVSVIFGLAIKSQISPKHVQSIIQESVSRLDKDFVIDFNSAEIKLSKWGLPIPFLEISQIRLSPRKNLCQDSQLFIDKLDIPLSLIALITSKSLVTEVSATQVEVRIAQLENCFSDPNQKKENKKQENKRQEQQVVATENLDSKNIFQISTATVLNKIKIDQLKIIFKNYPAQSLDLRQMQIDLFYSENLLNKIILNSKIYALRNPESNLIYFRGEISANFEASRNNQIEAEAKLKGQLLDGNFSIFFLYDRSEKSIKTDFTLDNIALKPFEQLDLKQSAWFNYPVAVSLQGSSQHQLENSKNNINLKSVLLKGERILIKVPKIEMNSDSKSSFVLQPFEADIQQLNLKKLESLPQLKAASASIENFGEFKGLFKFDSPTEMSLSGVWSDLGFIFSNRGFREIQTVDSFKVSGLLDKDTLVLNLNDFVLNKNSLLGRVHFKYHLKSENTEAEAQLSGFVLNEKVWQLLTDEPQNPEIKLQWNYKKAEQERHQIYLFAESIKAQGVSVIAPEIQMIQSLNNGESSGLALTLKAQGGRIEPDLIKTKLLSSVFGPDAVLNEKLYSADYYSLSLKGTDWKNMSFELDTKIKSEMDSKVVQTLKSRGQWTEDESLSGILTVQSAALVKRYELLRKENSVLVVNPL